MRQLLLLYIHTHTKLTPIFSPVTCPSFTIKVIPIDGDVPVNGEPQQTATDVLPEMAISRALSELSNVRSVLIVNTKRANKSEGSNGSVALLDHRY